MSAHSSGKKPSTTVTVSPEETTDAKTGWPCQDARHLPPSRLAAWRFSRRSQALRLSSNHRELWRRL